MKKLTALISGVAMTAAFGASAFATDVYVVNFRNAKDVKSQQLDGQLASALAISGVNAEEVVIDTTTAAKWEKGAHEAFDRDIVPVFNQWVGLPGFAAVVDAKSKRVIGCVNSTFSANEMAREIRQMASKAQGSAYLSNADYEWTPEDKYRFIVKTSVSSKTTRCPAAHNVDHGR